MKFQFQLSFLFAIVLIVAIVLRISEKPKHAIYSDGEMNLLLEGHLEFQRLAEGSMVEMKKNTINNIYSSVRVSQFGSDCYSELPLNEGMRLLSVIDKFKAPPPPVFDATESIDAPVLGECEIQYILRVDGALRMPISIEIIDESSLVVGFTFVTTSDPEVKKVVSKFLQLANKTFNANPYRRNQRRR